jgi:hypothetical protein
MKEGRGSMRYDQTKSIYKKTCAKEHKISMLEILHVY